jgi:hypothetical protein
VTPRKKKIIIIQLLLFLSIIFMFYFTYYKNQESNRGLVQEEDKSLNLDQKDQNTFVNVEYKGLDLNGNRYVIKSEEAVFDINLPELINMKIMTAMFYFKDGSTLEIDGNYGSYNNLTKDMKFREEIVSVYKEKKNDKNMDYVVYSDNLDFFSAKNFLKVYGNVNGTTAQGDLVADNVEFDIFSQTLKISMFDNGKVNVNLKK